jgi:Ras family protein T1
MEPRSARIILVGDTGVGKTSLVKCAVYEGFQPAHPETLNPITEQINQIETELIDTDAGEPDNVERLLRSVSPVQSCVVCLVCDPDWTESIDNVKHKWLPMIEKCCQDIPIMIIINNKNEASENARRTEEDLFKDFEDVLSTKKQVEFTIICDAKEVESVREVFDTAQRLALFPGCKLIDLKNPNEDSIEMRPELVSALKHVFRRADVDGDGILNEVELNELQRACFTEGEVGIDIMKSLKEMVQKVLKEGVTSKGFNWIGFEYIWKKMMEKGRFETFWVILRHCGFDDELKLITPSSIPPETTEVQELVLTTEAITFLRNLFEGEILRTGSSTAGGLTSDQVLELFDLIPPSLAPFPSSNFPSFESLRQQLPNFFLSSDHRRNNDQQPHDDDHPSSSDAIPRLSTEGWISLWHNLTQTDPCLVAPALPYLGFGMPQLSHTANKTSKGQKPAASLEAVNRGYSPHFHIHLVGLVGSGRTHLLRGFLNYPFIAMLSPHQQTLALGVVGISVATSTFKKTSMLTSLTSSASSSSTKTATNAKGKGKAQAAAEGEKKLQPWLPKADLAYQRQISWERGVLVITKHNLEEYRGEGVTRSPDLVLVVFDLSDLEAFARFAECLRTFRSSASHLAIQLVGTKSDLPDVVGASAVSLAAELELPAPIFTSALNNDYANLVPLCHYRMIQHRTSKWRTSAVTAISRSLGRSIVPHLPKIALAVGVGLAIWVAVANSGRLLPYLHMARTGFIRVWSHVRYVVGLPITWARNYNLEIARLDSPDPVVKDLKNRQQPQTQAILLGSAQRLGTQHR